MTKRIFKSVFVAAAAVFLVSLVIIFGVLYDYFSSLQNQQLESQLALAAQGIIKSGDTYFDDFSEKNCRITWIDQNGTVLTDTYADAAKMDNHADREEIKKAVEIGVGRSSRYSKTLMKKTTYLAQRLPDGTVLRVSVTNSSVFLLLLGMLQPLTAVLLFALILAALLASRMSKKIVEPLNELDLNKPLENETYDELAPLLRHIEQQRRQIKVTVNQLEHEREELKAITENLNEGLVVLNDDNTVLSINPAAKKIFNTDDFCIGQDFLVADRGADITGAIDAALSDSHSEVRIERGGRVYQLSASRISVGSETSGVVLLAVDITEMVYAEKNRREFTANVSHELKTPLQSIMGSAELIENGLVKSGDMPKFIGRIRTEASRLLTLIEDIIRLSQLDEKSEIPFEEVDILSVVDEVSEELCHSAGAKNITVNIDGKGEYIYGERRLVYEIIFNLYDNAIKYNTDGGSINISLSSDENSVVFEIEDTGIGIPKEAQSHVFERFYRVDKSRSKEIGGTGLGLSIVKHAASELNARAELESEPGKGTKIRIVFPAIRLHK